MNIRPAVIAALDKTTGLLDRPLLAPIALSGGDFDLSELDIDSLAAYEIMMQLEDEFDIELLPSDVESTKSLRDLVDLVERVVQAKP